MSGESKIRILFLIDKLTPAGTQTNLLEIIRGMDRTHFEPFLISLCQGGELEPEFRAAGVEPLILSVGKAYGFSGLKAIAFLAGWMRERRIDIVQTHFLHADLIGAIAGKLAGVRNIITTRRDEGFWRSRRQVMVNRLLNRLVRFVLVNSEAVRRSVIRDEDVNPEKIHVIHNGVHTEDFFPSVGGRQEMRRTLGLKNDDFVVSVAANMRHVIKGHSYLIEAAPKILKAAPQTKFLLVGDGVLRPNLEQYAEKFGVSDSILFLGARRDMNELLNAADISCLPSLSEGFSNAILEAMACGKPVVASQVGGNSEIIENGKTGYLIPARDSDALADKIVVLAKDQEQRKRMSAAARERIEAEFSVRQMVENYQSFYNNLCGRQQMRSNMGLKHLSANKKRICHLIWALEPGGAERQVVTIAKWQKAYGYEPVVVCLTRKGLLARELEAEGVRVELILKRPGIDFGIARRLANFLIRENITMLHTHVPTASLWGRLASFYVPGLKVIVSEHSDMSAVNPRFKLVNRFLSSKTDRFIVVSRHIKDLMSVNGVPAWKISVIHNGIPVFDIPGKQAAEEIRRELKLAPNALIVGTVGRLEPRKDFGSFMIACREIKKAIPESFFILVGDGPMRRDLEAQAEGLGIRSSVYFAGTRENVRDWLAAFDVFVLSSITEGISISLLEAMAAAKACVVTRVGGNPEVVTDGVTGEIVSSRAPHQLGAEIAQLLRRPEKRAELGTEARKTVLERFSLESMMKQIETVYSELRGDEKMPETKKRRRRSRPLVANGERS